MNHYKLFLLLISALMLQACANGPGKPGEAPTIQPSPTPNMNYIYRGPSSDVARALQ